MVQHITRPTREQYHLRRLGAKDYVSYSRRHVRVDRVVVNARGQRLYLSYYRCVSETNSNCVVYLHTNNGSRVEGLGYLNSLLRKCVNVCLFDFAGSGNSDGEIVTLGINEAQDIADIVYYLKKEMGVVNFLLWGRSMGAVASIIYLAQSSQKTNIKGLILDSPFKNLRQLIKEIAAERTGLPKLFFEPVMYFVNEYFKTKTGHTLDEYKLKKYLCAEIFANIPALFLLSKNDRLVPSHHGYKLFEMYACVDKELHYIDREHHESRHNSIVELCMRFIESKMGRYIGLSWFRRGKREVLLDECVQQSYIGDQSATNSSTNCFNQSDNVSKESKKISLARNRQIKSHTTRPATTKLNIINDSYTYRPKSFFTWCCSSSELPLPSEDIK